MRLETTRRDTLMAPWWPLARVNVPLAGIVVTIGALADRRKQNNETATEATHLSWVRQRSYAHPRGRTRTTTIVRVATSSSTITRQSPTRSRGSGRPASLRRSTLHGSSASRPIAGATV